MADDDDSNQRQHDDYFSQQQSRARAARSLSLQQSGPEDPASAGALSNSPAKGDRAPAEHGGIDYERRKRTGSSRSHRQVRRLQHRLRNSLLDQRLHVDPRYRRRDQATLVVHLSAEPDRDSLPDAARPRRADGTG